MSDDSLKHDLESLAKAVGLVVLQWGQAEQSLDLIVALLWQSFNGKQHAKKIPMMLDPKIRFIRTCIASEPLLSTYAFLTEELLSHFEELSSIRHDLIHGAVASIQPIDNAFVFTKLDIRDGFHHSREVRVDASEYPRLANELILLGRQAHELASQVFDVAKVTSDIN